MEFEMKNMILLAGLALGQFAMASEVYTTVSCSTTDGRWSGVQTIQTERMTFSADELKDILLQGRQVEDAPMPYPSDVVVAPRVLHLQEVNLRSNGRFPLQRAVYFTL